MKYIVVLFIVLLSSCTGNSTYTVMFENGQIQEVDNNVNITYNVGDTVVINTFWGRGFPSRSIWGKYINTIPESMVTYGHDSFSYISNYEKAVIIK